MNLARESAISAAINGVLSLVAFRLLFGVPEEIAVSGFAVDFAPQGFAVGLMGSLIPGLIARARIGAAAGTPSRIVLRALIHAVVAAALGLAIWWLGLRVLAIETLPWLPAAVTKVIYGALLGAAITWIMLKPMQSTEKN